jgi:hypothetical protein
MKLYIFAFVSFLMTGQAYAEYSSCEVTCTAGASKIFASTASGSGYEPEEFKAYCRSLGGTATAPGYQISCDRSKVYCYTYVRVPATGQGSASNEYDARQEARKACSRAIPEVNDCISYTNGGVSKTVEYDTPVCSH